MRNRKKRRWERYKKKSLMSTETRQKRSLDSRGKERDDRRENGKGERKR